MDTVSKKDMFNTLYQQMTTLQTQRSPLNYRVEQGVADRVCIQHVKQLTQQIEALKVVLKIYQ